jgi:hypothetical protein
MGREMQFLCEWNKKEGEQDPPCSLMDPYLLISKSVTAMRMSKIRKMIRGVNRELLLSSQ